MNNERLNRIFFMEVLKAGLWDNARICRDIGEKLGPQDFTPDWNLIMEWSKKQTVMGLVSAGVAFLSEELSPPADIRKNMVYLVFRNIQMNKVLNRVAVSLTETLKKENVDSVLLKGQGLARVYKNPKLRQCGDIDLYVGKKNYRKACEVVDRIAKIMNNQGDNLNDDSNDLDGADSLKHYNCNIKGIPIEIHKMSAVLSNPIYNKRFVEIENNSLNSDSVIKVNLEDGLIYVPPIDFDALFVFIHAWNHIFSSGLGLRQICDWAMYIHRFGKDMDVSLLDKRLSSIGLKKGWQIFGYIAVNYLGLPVEECLFYSDRFKKEADLLLSLIWEEGNFGHHSEDSSKFSSDSFLGIRLNIMYKLFKRSSRTFLIDKNETFTMIFFYIGLSVKFVGRSIIRFFRRKKTIK